MTSGAIRDPHLRGEGMSNQSGSGERAESLGVRRSVELPEPDIDAAADLAPADGSGSEEESGASADEAEDEAVDSPPGESEQAVAPKEGTEATAAKEDAAATRAIAVAARPDNDAAVDDGPPPDRPKKPVLAAVAIGGAVVLAIPILLIGTGSHDGKKHRATAAADRVMPGDGQQPPPGAFVSTSSTPTPLPSTSKKAKAKASKKATSTPTPSAKASAEGRVRSRSVSNERPSPSAPRSLVLHAPRDIYPGQTVRTSRIAMTMQSGGNLVLRDKSNKIIWSTGTHRSGVYAEFQTDGNLVLYAGDRQAVWGAGSFGHDKSTMVFQSDYNVVIIDHGGHPVWATGTNR
jgi:hypothetical protein